LNPRLSRLRECLCSATTVGTTAYVVTLCIWILVAWRIKRARAVEDQRNMAKGNSNRALGTGRLGRYAGLSRAKATIEWRYNWRACAHISQLGYVLGRAGCLL